MGLIKPIKKGIELPTLLNPAEAENIQNGYEAVNGNGNKITGKLNTDEIYTHKGASVNLNWGAGTGGILLGTSVNSFGEATPADVAAGVTVMTDNGLITGEATLLSNTNILLNTATHIIPKNESLTIVFESEPLFIIGTYMWGSPNQNGTYYYDFKSNSGKYLQSSNASTGRNLYNLLSEPTGDFGNIFTIEKSGNNLIFNNNMSYNVNLYQYIVVMA